MLRLELSWFLISSRSLCRPWGSVVGDCKEGWPAFSMIALVCTNSYIRPQNPGQDLLLTWLATRPQSSKLLKVFWGIPFTHFPATLPSTHPSGFSTGQVHSNKPWLIPRAPSPLPVRAGRGTLLQISTMIPILPYSN